MKRGHVPVRMCVICRLRAPQSELTRHTGRIGELCPDADTRRPGRGWYVCAQTRCLEKLARRGAGKKKPYGHPKRAGGPLPDSEQRASGFLGGHA